MQTLTQSKEAAQPEITSHSHTSHENAPHENGLLWFAKVASGVFIFFLLGAHLIANHLVAEGGLMHYEDVVRYLSHPWIAAIELTFLVCVVSHALLGLRSILLDLNPAPRVRRILDGFLLVLGSGSVIYGIWLTATIISRGKGA